MAAVALAGCQQCPDTAVGLDELVAEHNRPADAVPRLWALAWIQATYTTEGGLPITFGPGSRDVAPNGYLLLAKGDKPTGPHDFCLIGKEGPKEIFRAGISTREKLYYFWLDMGDTGAAWVGRNALAGSPQAALRFPLDPHQLVSLLTVTPLPASQTDIPAVALTFSSDPCAYVLTYIDRQPVTGRILFKRQMYFRWAEDQPRRPFHVKFLAPDGQIVLEADLSDYRPVELLDVDDEPDSPVEMATDIRVRWTRREGAGISAIRIRLADMTTADKWDPIACDFWDALPASLRKSVRRVD